MFHFAVTIFLSAFLLFQVQPLIARFILPWFGGTPAVWTMCMLFFQTLLLAGYAYAHLTSVRLTPRRQIGLHWVLLAVSLAFLPIIPDSAWKPAGGEPPGWRILAVLTATIGGPYLVLSTTGPLLQKWFSRTEPARSPYRLFALSNAGSLIALLSFPVLFEPNLTSPQQAGWWSAGYAAFVLLCGWCGWRAFQADVGIRRSKVEDRGSRIEGRDPSSLIPHPSTKDTPDHGPRTTDQPQLSTPNTQPSGHSLDDSTIPAGDVAMWLGLSAVPSVLLLAITNQMSQEVAVVPFLWVLPLSLYLLSFILCFERDRWYHRGVWGAMLLLVGAAATLFFFGDVVAARLRSFLGDVPLLSGLTDLLTAVTDPPIYVQVVAWAAALFACCMISHGELARSRPHPRHLTLFYLTVAGGGALGGVFVGLIAPRIFDRYLELPIGFIAFAALALAAWYRALAAGATARRRVRVVAAGVFAAAAAAGAAGYFAGRGGDDALFRARNFYGILTVEAEVDEEGDEYYQLLHGTISHGIQYRDPEYRGLKTSYYGEQSGVGVAIRCHPKRANETTTEQMHIGVVGLGAGTLAAYGRPRDRIRFYEINPDVIHLARDSGWFTYLRDSRAEIEVVLGDARIQLERELAAGRPQHFDVLAVDAFSSDAIPMHLLTRECFEVYWRHLREDGVLAVHISNRHLDLRPVVFGIAEEAGCRAVEVDYDPENGWESGSRWVLVTQNGDFLASPEVRRAGRPWPAAKPRLIWTDQYGSLLQVLK